MASSTCSPVAVESLSDRDRTLRVWDLASGQTVKALKAHELG